MANAVHPLHVGPPSPSQVPPSGTPGLPLLTAIVAGVVAVAALYVAREVLLPITLALLLSFVLSPLVELLRRIWLGHTLSVIVAVIVALGIILAIGTAIGSQVADLAKDIPQYQATIERKIGNLRAATVNRFSTVINGLNRQLAKPENGQSAPAPAAPQDTGTQTPGEQPQGEKPVPVIVTEPTPSALQIGEKVLTPLLNPVATAGIILVVTIFTLLQKEDLRDRAIRLFGSSDLERTTVAMDDAAQRLSRYFLIQLGLNTSFGVIVGVGLYVIGVPNPVLWGILGALLRFIPYIGAWIAAALPVLLSAAVDPGWSMAIWTAVLYAVSEVTMGQVVEPLVYGHSTGLSPLAVVIAAIFWTWIWGPVGLIISTPLTLCLVVLGRYVERLEFFDVLLGDRPALTPVEGFYQRMLAGDPDEAEEQAERYLKERSLSSYYDEVALKGLQLAANDIVRGTLAPTKLELVKDAVAELVGDLESYDDVDPKPGDDEIQSTAGSPVDEETLPKRPPPGQDVDKDRLAPEWQREAAILCVAGSGPLDEAVSSMLAQLLGKHGLGARVVPHEAVSRRNIGSLDARDTAMVCISYINIRGNPAHLRYLLRRLRERLPKAPLLVGLWPAADPILKDEALRSQVGADYYVSTLHDAVEACLAAAQEASPQAPQPVATLAHSGSR
ncbi:MAG TPA: AI-2E family transporter [Xanthobacteraceae bacterium]|nr:AI-2E family transporter [Xanthobacteraceae bacterium]